MKVWLRDPLRFALGAFVVYACAGRSISRSDDGDTIPSGDDGYGGTGGSVVTGGKGGTTTGKGGSPGKGGTAGKGGAAGLGGTITTGGKGGLGGTGIAGDDGIGGDDCLGRNVGSVFGTCAALQGCISVTSPADAFTRRNTRVMQGFGAEGGQGGQGGEGGDWGEVPDNMATAILCSDIEGREGFLQFEYFMPEGGAAVPGFTLATGDRVCQGPILAQGDFTDFTAPPRGYWSKQCVRVSGDELGRTVTVVVPSVRAPYPSVRRVEFVADCECPRQVTRYTTCGDITSPQECF